MPGASGKTKEKPIYLHLDFEKYQTRYIGKMKPNYMFQYKRMIPYKAKCQYFFTADGQQHCAQDAPSVKVTRERSAFYYQYAIIYALKIRVRVLLERSVS